jgi:leucyl aminopeptidase
MGYRMFKLSLKSSSKKISYKNLSISVRYFIDEKKLKESVKNFERLSKTKLSGLQKKNFLSSDSSEIRVPRSNGKPDEILLVKVKLDDKFTNDFFRNHLAGFLQVLAKEEAKSLHIFIPNYIHFKEHFDDEEYYYQTFAEGLFLGNYEFTNYKSDKKKLKMLEVTFHSDNEKKLRNALLSAQKLMSGVDFTKDLQNEPGGILTPDELCNRVKYTLIKEGIKVKIFDEKEICKRKMGGLLAVGMGSSNLPRFIVIEYNGAGKYSKSKKKVNKSIALIGKGVTFDSGGISIKPYNDMWEMKADMSGAAVVAGTILTAAKSKLPINIFGIIPAAENMLSGTSMRPGDIVITCGGKSIEVDNTDAEGRMILADALSYASKLNPSIIIDIATLTGACAVALGEFVAGLFTKNQELSKRLFRLGLKTHERVWALPMWDEYHTLNKSDVADVKNVGGKWGGAITAAKFLENFVDNKTSWVHLDIAGPALANNYNNYTKKYMTGFGVRLLFEYLRSN